MTQLLTNNTGGVLFSHCEGINMEAKGYKEQLH